MLFGITIIFIISWIPFWLGTFGFIKKNLILHDIFFINNCTNCFIYLIFQENFRKKIKDYFKQFFQPIRNYFRKEIIVRY